MLTERAWAMAMQLKEEWQEQPEDKARLKFHALRRLIKAAKYATSLQTLAVASADPRTILEADAYAAFMNGSVSLDKEKWGEALTSFVHAQTVFEQLVKVVDVEQQPLYRERAEQLENNVRLCKYKRDRQAGGSGADALADIKDIKAGIDDLLRAKLEGVMQEARAKQAEAMDKVTWNGATVPIKNSKIRLLLIQAGDVALELDLNAGAVAGAARGAATATDAAAAAAAPALASDMIDGSSPALDRYNALFQLFDDALTLTRQDLRELVCF